MMVLFKWVLFVVCLRFEGAQTKLSSWTLEMPTHVKGFPGSCVVIPCLFNYPDPESRATGFTGIWTDDSNHVIYHPVQSKMLQQYRGRTTLMGDIRQRNCSLKIDPLQESDHGPFHFRIEMDNYEKYSYIEQKVSITVPSPIQFTVTEEIEEGQNVSAFCSVAHSCPPSPPAFKWSHSGEENLQSQQLEHGLWNVTSTLTFQVTHADHRKPLKCTVEYKGGMHQEAYRSLQVKYAPINVKAEYQTDIQEGENVKLSCSSEAWPPASSYEWHNGTGALLHKGHMYMLHNVSRHTKPLYCVASNEAGLGKSSSVLINVLYAPEIQAVSYCRSELGGVKCICIVESSPPSTVHFYLADRNLQSTNTKKHGSLTYSVLQTDAGFTEPVTCFAYNTQGNASLTLSVFVDSKILYASIASGAVGIFLIILLVILGVKKWGKSSDTHTSDTSTLQMEKSVELYHHESKNNRKIAQCAAMNAEYPVYNNVDDYDDAHVYANM
ncbi:myelin-associated glycoprotein isoform X3 [Gouania willdenowi]|uniref:myelin-associated glycoprotein isoform X3 n=1 Tax=Gouania willdenowi TaxID=441366 RepID=UPI0010553AE7|nr:myelin-associated glycoprotein-like isoform X3 [Gouania willdenowi]